MKKQKELITKCLKSRSTKRSLDKLIIEQLFTEPNSEAYKLFQQAIDTLQARINARMDK